MKHYIFACFTMTLILGKAEASCGFPWHPPSQPFDSVNEGGIVSYWKSLGNLALGDRFTIPLYYHFSPSTQTGSPHFGKFWTIPFLEAHVVSLSENAIDMMAPNGRKYRFRRADSGFPTFKADRGWTGVATGPRFTAFGECGWRLEFVNGSLSRMSTPDGGKVEFFRNGDRLHRIMIGGMEILQVEFDEATDLASKISFSGKSFGFRHASLPMIAAETKVLSRGGRYSLEAISDQMNSGHPTTLYAVYPSLSATKTALNLKIACSTAPDRILTWDPKTNEIMQDDCWMYRISPTRQPSVNAAIVRINRQGMQESWILDRSAGYEQHVGIHGDKTVREYYLSKPNVGGLRRILREKDDVKTVVYESMFDAGGRLLGEKRRNLRFSYVDGTLSSIHEGIVPFPIIKLEK